MISLINFYFSIMEIYENVYIFNLCVHCVIQDKLANSEFLFKNSSKLANTFLQYQRVYFFGDLQDKRIS